MTLSCLLTDTNFLSTVRNDTVYVHLYFEHVNLLTLVSLKKQCTHWERIQTAWCVLNDIILQITHSGILPNQDSLSQERGATMLYFIFPINAYKYNFWGVSGQLTNWNHPGDQRLWIDPPSRPPLLTKINQR